MRVWRICRAPFAANTLAGLGGLYASGRWHCLGHPVLYTATSAALAALEVLVHVDPLMAPEDLRLITLDLPEDLPVETQLVQGLPAYWQQVPAPDELAALGTAWLISRRSAALIVPSAVIPVERNVLLNPLHPAVQRVRVVDEVAFTFDPRLLS